VEEVNFIQDSTIPYLIILVIGLLWLAILSIASRYSRLPPRKRAIANMLSLLAGPLGWAVQFASYRRHRERAAEEETVGRPSIGTREQPVAVPKPGNATPARSGGLFGWFSRKDENRNDSRFFNQLIEEAVEQQATDIHIEPHESHYLARIRVNGILRDYKTYNRPDGERLVAIAKVLSSLDVADKLKPQDGRFEWMLANQSLRLDIRISVSPSLRGEKLALRFLNRPASAIDMASLGMNEAMQKALRRAVRHPEGFILMAGPTGSGKTSTAYSILSLLAGPSVNIMTIEDPVEYTLPYATQIAVNPKLGVTFENGLPTLLRQDPDIILIGEMREAESFRIGIRASLSGHLVISTMHARDSIQVFANLRNIGIEPSSLAAAVKLVVAQRLVRVLCPYCKEQEEELDEDIMDFLGGEALHIPVYQPGAGCDHCFQSGFTGRTGIFEFLTMDSTVKEWLEEGQHESDLRRALIQRGQYRPMREDARDKVLAGEVWSQDAIRAVGMEVV
jgi:general secretion pathway protein E